MTEAGRLRLAIDLDGVLTEHPRPLAHAASARFGVEMSESAFVDSAGLNVPDQVRDWVYSPDGPAAQLQPDPRAAEFLRRAIALVGAENIAIVTARPEPSAEMTRTWLRAHGFPECPIVFADLKAAVALRSGFSHAVEDSLRHARNYAAAGVRCFLVKAGEPGDKLDDPMIAAADDLDALFDIIAEHIARGGQDAVNDPLTTSTGALETDGVETRPRDRHQRRHSSRRARSTGGRRTDRRGRRPERPGACSTPYATPTRWSFAARRRSRKRSSPPDETCVSSLGPGWASTIST